MKDLPNWVKQAFSVFISSRFLCKYVEACEINGTRGAVIYWSLLLFMLYIKQLNRKNVGDNSLWVIA